MTVPNMPLARTVAPSDTSTSVVINGSGPPIRGGDAQLTTHNDVLYDTPISGDTQIPLKLDVQVPQAAGNKPLVVYISGGGFLRNGKAANLGRRTYVAEQGYVVASIQYLHRAIPDFPWPPDDAALDNLINRLALLTKALRAPRIHRVVQHPYPHPMPEHQLPLGP
jgi:acetyl esterase/lipase